MSDKTGIEWTDATWNPLRGCSRVSEGCRNCYAETVAARFSGPGQPYEGLARRSPAAWTGVVRLVPEHMYDPLRWTQPRRIFVNSMSDLFHPKVPDEWIDRVFAVMALARQHTFQVLTKRPERMREYLTNSMLGFRIGAHLMETARGHLAAECATIDIAHKVTFGGLPNVWLGASVEDQATADRRIPELLATPAAVRFVSYEPALGPVDFVPWVGGECLHEDVTVESDTNGSECRRCDEATRLDWIIAGGESGPGARPMHPSWARSTIAQCRAAGVACFFKQEGAWTSRRPENWVKVSRSKWSHESVAMFADGTFYKANEPDTYGTAGMVTLYRHGGHNCDPAEWPDDLRVREFP